MAAPALKFTFFFTDAYGYGWTENYWYVGPQDTINTNVFAQNYAGSRLPWLSNDCTLGHCRVSGVTARDPYFINLNPSGLPNGQSTGPSSADFIAVVIRWDAGAGGYGRIFARGIPQTQITGDSFTPNATYRNAVNTFISIFKPPQNVWAVRSTLNSPTNTFPITSLTPLTPRGWSFLSTVNFVTPPQPCYVTGCSIPGYNGRKNLLTMQAIGPNFQYTVGGAKPPAPEPTTSAPKVRVITPAYPLILNGVIEGLTRRSAGRPFGQRRGRRRTFLSLRS